MSTSRKWWPPAIRYETSGSTRYMNTCLFSASILHFCYNFKLPYQSSDVIPDMTYDMMQQAGGHSSDNTSPTIPFGSNSLVSFAGADDSAVVLRTSSLSITLLRRAHVSADVSAVFTLDGLPLTAHTLDICVVNEGLTLFGNVADSLLTRRAPSVPSPAQALRPSSALQNVLLAVDVACNRKRPSVNQVALIVVILWCVWSSIAY